MPTGGVVRSSSVGPRWQETESGSRRDGPSDEWEDALLSMLVAPKGQSLHLVGVGNPMRQDDGVGIQIIRILRRRFGSSPFPGVKIHGPGADPERMISRVAVNGERLVVFDAVDANRPPGTIVCANLVDTKFGYFATHNIPLTLIPGIKGNPEAGLVVGIQPESLEVTEGLTKTVEDASQRVVEMFASIIGGTRND